MRTAAEPDSRTSDYPLLLRQAGERAGEAGGWVEHDLEIGPRRLRLRFAGDALVPFLLDALRAVVRPPGSGPVDATISIWDTASTGVQAPEPGWRGDEVLGRTAVQGLAGVAQDPGSGSSRCSTRRRGRASSGCRIPNASRGTTGRRRSARS